MPLTTKERIYVEYQDSIERFKTSKEYLDSLDAASTTITVLKVLWSGFGHIDREKKVNWSFDPVISLIDPVAIGGWRFRYSFNYYKKFDSTKRTSSISPDFN